MFITTRFLETLERLKENVGNNIIYCGDDPYNNFLYIKFAHKVYGIACCVMKFLLKMKANMYLLYVNAV